MRCSTMSESRVIGGEQSNSSVIFGDVAIFKLFRRLEAGASADVEVARYLTARTSFRNTPELYAVLVLEREGERAVAGMLLALRRRRRRWLGVRARERARRARGADVAARRSLRARQRAARRDHRGAPCRAGRADGRSRLRAARGDDSRCRALGRRRARVGGPGVRASRAARAARSTSARARSQLALAGRASTCSSGSMRSSPASAARRPPDSFRATTATTTWGRCSAPRATG